MRAIQITETGGPEVLQLRDVEPPTLGSNDVAVEVAAAGVNFIDTYHRSGLYPVQLPFTLGSEGAGRIVAIGADVTDRAIGDEVAWAAPSGSYAEIAVVGSDRLVRVPAGIGLDVAAATMLQGMTAHYLAHDTYPLSPGDRCLIHAGAGGVGLILIQLAKRLGAEVFATVGSAAKAELTGAAGADHTILYRDTDFAAAVVDIAGERPIDVVYDGVGAATFAGGLGLLRRRGMMVTFGNASGPVEPIAPLALSNGSLFLTRPTLWDYVATPEALEARGGEILDLVQRGDVAIRIGHRFDLADARAAHEQLEARLTTGKILLVP